MLKTRVGPSRICTPTQCGKHTLASPDGAIRKDLCWDAKGKYHWDAGAVRTPVKMLEEEAGLCITEHEKMVKLDAASPGQPRQLRRHDR